MLGANLLWWRWAHGRLAGRRVARIALLVFLALPVLFVLSLLVWPDGARRAHHFLPMWAVACAYLWNLLVMPLAVIGLGLVRLPRWALRREDGAGDGAKSERRRFLGACAAAVPPVLTLGTAAYALQRIDRFRLRRFEFRQPGLPPALDGLKIAHISDLHCGKFTTGRLLDQFVHSVNSMEADLVLFTGDLIDLSLADLPEALETLQRLEPQSRVFLCEGNHDLIDDPRRFRQRVKSAGFKLLLTEAAAVEVRGERVQLLGVKWRRGDAARSEEVRRVLGLRDPAAFPILLAHHPHCFDDAGSVPLTLAGHTHGGLLMVNERLGPGPLLYRYWSGLYETAGRNLVVSNGVGTWFPLRTGVSAEVGQLILRA